MTLKSNEIDLIEAVPPRFFNLKYICLGGGILKGTVFYYLPNLATVPESWWVILMDERSPSHMNLGPFQTIWVHGEISLSLPVLVGAGDPEFGKQHGNKTSPLSGWRGFA